MKITQRPLPCILVLTCLLTVSVASGQESRRRANPQATGEIQQRINAAANGDVIIIPPGHYLESIDFKGKDIVLTSEDPLDPNIVAHTIIDARDAGPVVSFVSGETPAAVLTGFTLMGGKGVLYDSFDDDTTTVDIWYGGGIFCEASSPTISRNVLRDNHMPADEENVSVGGGIACIDSQARITQNVIMQNSASIGGALLSENSITLANNLIYLNRAHLYAGGAYLSAGLVINNSFVANSIIPSEEPRDEWTFNVGHIMLQGPVELVNNLICGSDNAGLVSFDMEPEEQPILRHNNIWGNSGGDYVIYSFAPPNELIAETVDFVGQSGNLSQDPLFIDAGNHDYRLHPDSPCINAGDPNAWDEADHTDLVGTLRIMGGALDIGAYEYPGYTKPRAQAGPDQRIPDALETVTLDGSRSYFYDPCEVQRFQWTQVSGHPVTLSQSTAMRSTFVPDQEGIYVFSLVVSDAQHSSPADQVIVVVGNRHPIALVTAASHVTLGQTLLLDGSASYDPDPIDSLSYTWLQTQGPSVALTGSDQPHAACVIETSGIYEFSLVVGDGLQDSDPCHVAVNTITIQLAPTPLPLPVFEGQYQQFVDISHSQVSSVGGLAGPITWDVHLMDLISAPLRSSNLQAIEAFVCMDEQQVVWLGGEDFDRLGLYGAGISLGNAQVLREARADLTVLGASLSQGRVVWMEQNQGQIDVWGADITDLAQPVLFPVAQGVGLPLGYDPYLNGVDVISMDKDLAVWESQGQLYGADLSDPMSPQRFTISASPSVHLDPVVSGAQVVWTDQRNDAGDLYGADLSDPQQIQERPWVVADGTQEQPDLKGDRLVYVDGSTYGVIKLGWLSDQQSVIPIALSSPLGHAYTGRRPALDGDKVVWISTDLGLEGLQLNLSVSIP